METPDLKSMQNARDVGGISVSGGGQTKTGVLYRSDAPAENDVPPNLTLWPPRTVIDLRSAREQIAEHPLASRNVAVHEVPLSAEMNIAELADSDIFESSLEGLYSGILRNRGMAIAEVVGIVAAVDGPVLVHCAAGKDRTGLVIATILAAVGVSRDDIVADYVKTGSNMGGVVARIAADGPLTAEALDVLVGQVPRLFAAPAEAIATALDTFDRAGGARRWLLAHGMSQPAIDRLVERLVEQP